MVLRGFALASEATLLQALKSQDMYLAGAFILLNGGLVLIGTLISDILLAISDPRIRLS
jgi:peptide/nickel transport system permease protein